MIWRFLLIIAACVSLLSQVVLCDDADDEEGEGMTPEGGPEHGASAEGAVETDEEPVLVDGEEEGEDGESTVDPDAVPEEQVPLSSNQMHTLHGKIDTNRDGKLTLVEITDFSKKMRMETAKKEMPAILSDLDKDEDGKVSLQEVLGDENMYEGIETEEDKAALAKRNEVEKAKFQAADANKNNFLEVEELPAIFFPDTHPVVLQIETAESFKDKDTDGDGKLTQKEFWQNSAAGEDAGTSEDEQGDFKRLDTDKNGHLDPKEFQHYESGNYQNEEAFRKLIELADKDGDKMVTADELVKAREPISKSDAQYHLSDWNEMGNDEL